MADDDKELFDTAFEDAAPEVNEPASQPRDEHGRFAPKQEVAPEPEPVVETPPAVDPQPEQSKEPGIPPWRLREEAEARRAAEERAAQHERELAEMRAMMAQLQQQPKQPPRPAPNVFEDPEGYQRYIQETQTSSVQQARLEARFEFSEALMRDRLGDEKFAELQKWALSRTNDPAFESKMMNSRHPWGEASKMFEQERVLSQVGNDPNAWFEKQLEERAKDPTFQAKLLERIRGNVQPGQRPVTQLPPSLNKAPSAAPANDSGDDDSDAGLLKSALRR